MSTFPLAIGRGLPPRIRQGTLGDKTKLRVAWPQNLFRRIIFFTISNFLREVFGTDITEMTTQLLIRAGPIPEDCYICGMDQTQCKRYSIPSVYYLTDLYAITGSLEPLKHINVFWLCPEHYEWFDDMDRHRHFRDVGKTLRIKVNGAGEKLISYPENPNMSAKHILPGMRSLSSAELYRVLEIIEQIKLSHSAILSSLDVERPKEKLIKIPYDRRDE